MQLKYNLEKFINPIDLKFTNAYTGVSEKILNNFDNIIDQYNNITSLYWDINFKDSTNKTCYATININSITESVRNSSYDIYNGIVYKNGIIVENKTTIVINNNLKTNINIPSIENNETGLNFFYIKILPVNPNIKYKINFNSVKLNYENCVQIDTTTDIIKQRFVPTIYHMGWVKLLNVKKQYKEFIVLKEKKGYYNTMNFINGSIGFDLDKKIVRFSLWNTRVSDTYYIPSEYVQLNLNTVFINNGSGIDTQITYPLKQNERYGLMVISHTIDRPKTRNYPFGKITYYSGFFINLGNIDTPNTNPTWIYISTLKCYRDINNLVKRDLTKIEGTLERYKQTDDLLFTANTAVGNLWASDGNIWEKSISEEFITQYYPDGKTINVNVKVYDTDSAMLNIEFGGRVSGNLFENYAYRTNMNQQVPPHILDLPNQFPFINNMDSLINLPTKLVYSNYVMFGDWLENEQRVYNQFIDKRSDGSNVYMTLQSKYNTLKVVITDSNNNVIETYMKDFNNNIYILNKLNYNVINESNNNYTLKDFFNLDNLSLSGFIKSPVPLLNIKYVPVPPVTTVVDELLPIEQIPITPINTNPPPSSNGNKKPAKFYILIGISIFFAVVLVGFIIYFFKFNKN